MTKALCVPYDVASREMETYQGIHRPLLVLRNDLDHWLRTRLGLFDKKVERPVLSPERDEVLSLFSARVRPGDRRNFLDHAELRREPDNLHDERAI